MKDLILNAFSNIRSLLKGIQVQRFFAVVLVGFLLLTTKVDSRGNNNALGEQVREQAAQIDSVRPKTTREWEEDARATENSPGERLQKIGEQSAQAIKEFGSVYPDTAKRTTQGDGENQG